VNSARNVLDDVDAAVDRDDDIGKDAGEAVKEVTEQPEGSRPGDAGSKHLILFDLLAILLITEPKSDVAATMLVIDQAPRFYSQEAAAHAGREPLCATACFFTVRLYISLPPAVSG